ncbi:MAG: AraC family transcriptional regulator ligand-binding domain-containing protein [Litorilituus sp.]|jgi:AraC-like DNA-binding protein|nr:AraC family transcriptional regulator ligand-binding domain-containing protein [Litorilituus sp.]
MIEETAVTSNMIGQVFAHKLYFIATTLAKNGVDVEVLLKDTGMSVHELNNRDYKITKDQIVIFYRNVLSLKIPTLSILLGSSIKVNDYGLYGCTLLCCKGLQSTLEFSVRYHNLVTKTVNMSLHIDEQLAYSYFRFEDLLFTNDLMEFNIEFQCSIVLSLVRECVDNNKFAFDELRLSFNRPKNHLVYEEHFQCPISYNNKYNEFVMKYEKLLLETPRSNPFAMPLLLDQCNMVLNSIAAKNEFLITINQWVAANMHKELHSEELASYLCITPRTLRRKLSEQGTCFRDIVKELRCEAAKKLIMATQLTIEDVGCSIGFSDVSNFRAAFKKWTGQTPSSYRAV